MLRFYYSVSLVTLPHLRGTYRSFLFCSKGVDTFDWLRSMQLFLKDSYCSGSQSMRHPRHPSSSAWSCWPVPSILSCCCHCPACPCSRVLSSLVSSVWSGVCLVQFTLQFLPVCLFVDEGAEDQVGPLHRFPSHEPVSSGERRRLLAPSISVSVPDDDPSPSDEEYYEHPLFRSQWTTSSVPPSVPAHSAEAHLGQEKGEPSMVPFCSSSPACSFGYLHPFSVPSCGGGGQETVFSIWMRSPYIGCIDPNASKMF